MRTVVGLSQPISDNQAQKLDGFAMTFNRTMRQLYVDLIINKKNTNILKSDCIANNNLNARHYNSIKFAVEGKTKSVIELNKNYLAEAQDNLKSEQ